MTLGYRAAGALLESTNTNILITPPAGQANTDISFMHLALKGCTVAVPPVGWSFLTKLTSGNPNPAGLDTGPMQTVLYMRFGICPDAEFEVTSATNASVVGRIHTYTRGTSDLFQFTNTVGFDGVQDANYLAPGNDNLFAQTDDWLLAFTSLNSDAGTRTVPTITAAGIVPGAANTRSNDQSNVGNDSGIMAVDLIVTSGTETGVPSFAFTNASSTNGGTVFIRLRRVTAEIEVLPQDDFSVKAGYDITASGLTGFSEFEIQRVDTIAGTGTEVVRGGGRQTLSGATTAVAEDYEFSFKNENGIVTTYRWDLLLYLNGALQGTVASLPRTPLTDVTNDVCYEYGKSPFAWIKSTTSPLLNQPVSIGEFEGYARAGRILGRHNVLGRKNPVVVSDVLSGTEGTFTVLVDAQSAWLGARNVVKYNQDLRLLFETGSVYYFQSLDPFSTAVPDFFFTVETADVKRWSRIVGQSQPNPTTIWTVKFVEVDRPGTLDVAVSARTWDSVKTENTTWLGVLNNNESWLVDVFLGD